jgi:hypothetical protein
MSHASPLEHWHEFYLLLGTAAAALVALLFVAVSVGAGILSARSAAATRVYFSPVVVHFSTGLYASLLALVPSQTAASLAVLIGVPALACVVFNIVISTRLLRHHTADLQDRLGYGLGPLACYAAGVAAAGLFAIGHERAAELLAAALVVLLMINIRNAWDLALTMVRRQSERNRDGNSA